MIRRENIKTFITYQQEVMFVRILIPYTMGILLFYPVARLPIMWLCFFTGLLLLVLLSIVHLAYNRLKAYKFKTATGLVFFFFWIAFGGYCCLFKHELIQTSHFSHKKYEYIRISIIDEPQIKNNVIRFNASVTEGYKKQVSLSESSEKPEQVNGKLIISIRVPTNDVLNLQYGDELLIHAKIRPIIPPAYPSDFDYRFWLAMQNIYHRVFLLPKDLIKLNSTGRITIQKLAIKLRAKQVSFFRSILKDESSCAFASTLILGYKSDLSKETLEIYSKTGTIHALSVSGMHVGIVYFVLHWLLSFMNKRKWTTFIKVVLILCAIWLYAFLTGLSPAVLRSAIMLSVYIIAKLFNRYTNSYNIIAFSAFCLLLYNPFLLWDIGFQLSFVAVFGLIWLQPLIVNWLHFKQSWVRKIWNAVAISLAAQVITFPLSIYYFHQFPVYFLISNLFILVPIAILMYLGLAIVVFRIEALGQLFEWIINFTNKGLSLIAKLPMNTISEIWLSKTELILLYVSLFIGFIGLTYYSKKMLFIGMTLYLVFQSMLTYDHFEDLLDKKPVFSNKHALHRVVCNQFRIFWHHFNSD